MTSRGTGGVAGKSFPQWAQSDVELKGSSVDGWGCGRGAAITGVNDFLLSLSTGIALTFLVGARNFRSEDARRKLNLSPKLK